MTNSIIFTGTIEDIARFNKFGFVVNRDGSKKAFLHLDVLNDSGFTSRQLSDESELVVEVVSALKGLQVTQVLSLDGRKGTALTAQPNPAPRLTVRTNQKRQRQAPQQEQTAASSAPRLTRKMFHKIGQPIARCDKTEVTLHRVRNKDDEVAQYVFMKGDTPLLSTGKKLTEPAARAFLEQQAPVLMETA
jgi:cold shock CspA family protein